MARHTASVKEDQNASSSGLCADCVHARIIKSDRGSTFVQCQVSFTDSSFAKYPPLPVLNCEGYTKESSKPWQGP